MMIIIIRENTFYCRTVQLWRAEQGSLQLDALNGSINHLPSEANIEHNFYSSKKEMSL